MLRFSRLEWQELGRAWLAISLAFAIMNRGGIKGLFSPSLLLDFLISGITVGFGFLIHELAHKYFAQRYGCWAEFRAFNQMLLFALIFSLFGFVIAAPGGVFIRGHVSVKRNGIISLSGPLTNLALSVFFLAVAGFVPFIEKAALMGASINAWLAAFNLIPIMPFDGAKVWQWSKVVWFFSIAASAVLVFGWRAIFRIF